MAKRSHAKSTKAKAGKRSASKAVDVGLAARALAKRGRNEEPTRREMEALRRVEKVRDEERRLDHYATVPQKHYRELSGRQTKQLQDVARRHGIPCDGRRVDLFAVIKSLHDLIAVNAARLKRVGEDEEGDGVLLEFWKTEHEKAKAQRAQRLNDLEEGKVVPREEHEAGRLALVRWVVGVMERAGSELAAKLAGKSAAEVRRVVGDHFNGVRREAVQREAMQRDGGARGTGRRQRAEPSAQAPPGVYPPAGEQTSSRDGGDRAAGRPARAVQDDRRDAGKKGRVRAARASGGG